MQNNFLNHSHVDVSFGWTARIRPPVTQPWNKRVVLLLHGWTGDENIMWIFARKLPQDCYVIAPRAPLFCPDGGYAWAIPENDHRPGIEIYLNHCENLLHRLKNWIPEVLTDFRLDVIGFSQGAAMAYAMCVATNPVKVAPLGGYIPPGLADSLENRSLSSVNFFIAHNTDDSIVPVDESRRAVNLLSSKGADVQFCESSGGHKVSTACFNALDNFLGD